MHGRRPGNFRTASVFLFLKKKIALNAPPQPADPLRCDLSRSTDCRPRLARRSVGRACASGAHAICIVQQFTSREPGCQRDRPVAHTATFQSQSTHSFYLCAGLRPRRTRQGQTSAYRRMHDAAFTRRTLRAFGDERDLGGVVGARDEGARCPRLGAAGVHVDAGAGDVPHGGEL
jgi:hypothetical protein